LLCVNEMLIREQTSVGHRYRVKDLLLHAICPHPRDK
jgi:hypothetical protein